MPCTVAQILAKIIKGSVAAKMLNLPPEIRNHIYDVLFQQPFRVVLGVKALLEDIDRSPQSSELLQTCRKIHDEAIPFVYQHVSVKLTTGHCMLYWKEVADFRLLGFIQHLSVHRSCEGPLYLQGLRQLPSLQSFELWMTLRRDRTFNFNRQQCATSHTLLDAVRSLEDIKPPAMMNLNLCFQIVPAQGDSVKTAKERVRLVYLLFYLMLIILCSDCLF